LSQGVPRLINVICDRALLGAYSLEVRRVNARLIRRAAAEVSGELQRSPWLRPIATAAGILGVAIIAASIWSASRQQETQSVAEVPVKTIVTEAVAAEPEPRDSAPEKMLPEIPAETPEPEAEPEPEPEPTLKEQLQLAGELTTTTYALASLFDIWGLEYRTGARNGCAQAGDAGLACYYQRGSWSSLRQMDRPAILTLTDDNGENHAVVLTAIQGASAELSIGGVRTSHPVESISEIWFGQYMLLWRPAGGTPVSLGPGTRSDEVLWLRTSLAAISDEYASDNVSSDEYDAGLEQLVRTFQRDHRLDVDGLAGQQTQIIVNSLLAIEGIPRLTTPRLAQD
jgi:general secretion pathway protein A